MLHLGFERAQPMEFMQSRKTPAFHAVAISYQCRQRPATGFHIIGNMIWCVISNTPDRQAFVKKSVLAFKLSHQGDIANLLRGQATVFSC